MTRKESWAAYAIVALKKVSESDQERGHIDADEVLCALLKDLGYGDVVAAYKSIPKWYA